MKTIFRLSILLLLANTLLYNCTNEPVDPAFFVIRAPFLTTAAVTNISANSATSGGSISSDGGAAVTDRGIVWGTSPNPTIFNSSTFDGTGAGDFISQMTGLTVNVTYYVRAYATNSIGTSYGNTISFTTFNAPTAPVVVTSPISNIGSTTATGGGAISSDGGSPVTSRGVVYGVTTAPTTSGTKTIDGSGVGNFTSMISALTPVTTYYVRAYAVNSVGTSYGIETSFVTTSTSALPTVNSTLVTTVTTNSATSGGTVTADGGAPVTARGVVWSTSPSPTLANSSTVDGAGLGTFTSLITGLTSSTLYHVRAYATNSIGTAYSPEVTFTTL